MCKANLILLSGLDGTGLLFKPFLDTIPVAYQNKIDIFIYDLNAFEDQSIEYQVQQIETQVKSEFENESVIIIAESYSGLLAYELIKRRFLNIDTVILIACFLNKPSLVAKLARYVSFLRIKWTKLITDKVISYVIFNNFGTHDLLALFREAMLDLEDEKKQKMFIKRCHNIYNLPANQSISKPSIDTVSTLKCSYL